MIKKMLQTKTQLTLEEFFALPADDVTYELVNGEAIPKMSPKKFHSRLTRVLLQLLFEWCGERGEVCPELGIKLTRKNRDWVPIPDLLYISRERFPADWDQDGVCSVPPELVIEIISPGQTFGDLMTKARDYLNAGVLRVWIVDSQARSITVFYPDAPAQTYRSDTPLIDSLFEGLEITAEQVFQLAKIPK